MNVVTWEMMDAHTRSQVISGALFSVFLLLALCYLFICWLHEDDED